MRWMVIKHFAPFVKEHLNSWGLLSPVTTSTISSIYIISAPQVISFSNQPNPTDCLPHCPLGTAVAQGKAVMSGDPYEPRLL
jgi:hypothetical protein